MSQSTCSVENCQRIVYALDRCNMHHRRWRTHGDPLITLTPTRVLGTLEERFNAKIDTPDDQGCILWNGFLDGGGYGRFSVGNTMRPAHRISYEMNIGKVPIGMELDHLCHTLDLSCPGGGGCKHRRCVNFLHLEVVTHKENCRRSRKPVTKRTLKTHCKNNHEFTPENIRLYRGRRICIQCNIENSRKYRERQ